MAAPSQKSTGHVLRSLSPSGKFCNSRPPPASCSSSSSFFNRATSPTRISLCGSSGSVPSVRFISVAGTGAGQMVRRQSHKHHHHHHHQKRTCMCSPTTHPGSFRCSLHKSFGSRSPPLPAPANRLNARRSAMTNSLVRIGGVEGELVRRALAALIRPSSHQQRRRGEFRPQQSRLSVMSVAEEAS